MRNFLILWIIAMKFVSCASYFSRPQGMSGYSLKKLSEKKSDTIQIWYSILYDSVAPNRDRDKLLMRGEDFNRVADFVSSNIDSLFNFGYIAASNKLVNSEFLEKTIQRSGRKNIILNNHLLPRPLFGEFFVKIISASTLVALPKGDILIIDLKFGKNEYSTGSYNPRLASYTLADITFVRNEVVLYSRVWAAQPFLNIWDEQLDQPRAQEIRWFTENNFRRLAAAIRKDLSQKLMR